MTDQTERKTFEIPEWNIPKLEKKITAMNKKADKIGCPHVEIEVLGERKIPAAGFEAQADVFGLHTVPQNTVYEIAFNGEGPKIAGWKFIGTLDHITLPGSVIVNTVPGENVPADFYHNEPVCDHCGKIRRRNETFVLEHDEGEFTQVGRQCLKDFLGHDPAAVARWLTSLNRLTESLGEEDEWFGGGGGRHDYFFNSTRVLMVTAAIIKKYGWVPKSAADFDRPATAGIVMDAFMPPAKGGRVYEQWQEWLVSLNIDTEDNQKEAVAAQEWLKTQDANNEYMHNLHALAKAEGIPFKMFGYWCSLVATYQRAQERLRLAAAQKKLNEYFGEIKKRVDFNVKVLSIKYTEGLYGPVGVVRMLDDDGRTIMWFANTEVDMKAGLRYNVKATVRKHEVYNNWKQTIVNRVKVLTELEDSDGD